MSKLTTHVLDTANGVPASNLKLRLFRLQAGEKIALLETTTNTDGRCDSPLLSGDSMQAGTYELEFEAGSYFSGEPGGDSGGNSGADIRFLDCVVLRFGISDPCSHYHVPLLVSPYSYSTYRGS